MAVSVAATAAAAVVVVPSPRVGRHSQAGCVVLTLRLSQAGCVRLTLRLAENVYLAVGRVEAGCVSLTLRLAENVYLAVGRVGRLWPGAACSSVAATAAAAVV